MRKTRIGAIAASGALAAASILGGAGIAQAQSDILPGSEAPEDQNVTLSVDDADEDGVHGVIGNNTDAAFDNCTVTVANADDVAAAETGNVQIPEDSSGTADVEGVGAGTAEWTVELGELEGVEEPYGASVECDEEDTVYAYQDEGPFGSVELGSLEGDSLEDLSDS